MAIDAAFVNGQLDQDGSFKYTLVHEAAHLFSLNDTQIASNSAAVDECSTYLLDEGCLYGDVYLEDLWIYFGVTYMMNF